MKADAGEFPAHTMEQGLDEDHADRRRHAENDIADRRALGGLEAAFEPIDLVEERSCMFEYDLADIAELGAAPIAPQQRRTAFILKLPDAAAQGGLRNAQMARAEGETAKLGDADEIAKTLEIHIADDSYNRKRISDSPDLPLAAIRPGH
jgi:hypothetical protein